MTVRGLGNVFDIVPGYTPIADAEVAATATRLHMKNYGGTAIVGYFGAVSAGTDVITLDVQQADAATGGNTKDLDVVTQVYYKAEATLDGDETWTRATQSAASEVAFPSTNQILIVVEIDADDLDTANGYEWVFVLHADPGSGGTRPGCYFYVPYGLKVQRRPDLLIEPNG
jgi:hypothetical protein